MLHNVARWLLIFNEKDAQALLMPCFSPFHVITQPTTPFMRNPPGFSVPQEVIRVSSFAGPFSPYPVPEASDTKNLTP